jgi:hypothetical protein
LGFDTRFEVTPLRKHGNNILNNEIEISDREKFEIEKCTLISSVSGAMFSS